MADFSTGIPNIRVIIREASDENLTAQLPNLTVNIKEGTQYNVNMVPNTVSALRTGSFNSYADLAGNAWTASYAISVTSASAVLGGTTNYVPLWTSNTTLSSSFLYQTGSSVLLGATTQHTPEAPDRFGVFAGVTDSYNLISAHGEIDSYLQVNLKNFSSGVSASTDLVATADNGTELVNYIDMGINGSQYNIQGLVGSANDAYLYSTGNHLNIGNATTGKKLTFFVGGTNVDTTSKLILRDTNQHEITGSLTVSQGVTGSLFGTASWAQRAITSSYAATASYFEGTMQGIQEEIILSSSVGATTSSFDFSNASIFYLTGMTGNGIWNITNVPTTAQKATTFTFVLEQGATPYSASGYQLNSSNVTVKWLGSSTPTGSANKTDIVGLTAFRSGSTWNVVGVLSSFG